MDFPKNKLFILTSFDCQLMADEGSVRETCLETVILFIAFNNENIIFSELFTNCIQDTFNGNMHREKMENTHENGGVKELSGLLLCTNAHNIQPSGRPLADSQLGGDRAVNVCECLKLHCPLKRMLFNRCLL